MEKILAMPKFVNQCMYKCVRKKWAARLVLSLVSFTRVNKLAKRKGYTNE